MKKNNRRGEISFLGSLFLGFRSIKEKIKEMRLPERFIARHKRNAGYEGENSPREAKLSFGFGLAS